MKKSIGVKIYVMITVLFLVFLGNAITANLALSNSKQSFKDLAEIYLELESNNTDLASETVYAKLYMNTVVAGIMTGDTDSIKEGMVAEVANISEIRATLATMTELCEKTESEDLITAFEAYRDRILSMCDTVDQLVAALQSGADVSGLFGSIDLSKAYAEIDNLSENFSSNMKNSSDAVVTERIDEIEKSNTQLLVAVAIYIIASVIVVLVVIKSIANPAKIASRDLDSIIEKINNNEGDLTDRIEVKTQDEVGQLVNGVNGFIEQLQTIMQTIQRESGRMSESVDSINEKISESNENASDVSATMEELSASMEEVAATLDQLNGGVAQVLDEAKRISDEAKNGAEFVQGIRDNTKAIKADTISSKENTNTMIDENKASLETAIKNSRNVEQINELTNDILSISGQTNLLALNASIEAARAGDAGRGFAVVAEEIRVLADNTRVTANRIQEISSAVTTAVGELASRADDMLKFVSDTVLSDYDKFVGVAVQYSDDADSMEKMLSQFKEGAENLANTVNTMSIGINDINVTVDDSAKGVANAAESTNNLVTELTEIGVAAGENKDISDLLTGEVKRFKHI